MSYLPAGSQRIGSSPCGKKKVSAKSYTYAQGAIIRGDTAQRKLALVFTGDEYADGGNYIARLLKQSGLKASFFFTGRFYRTPAFKSIIRRLHKDGHYLGAHSDAHLLYCDWTRRDSLLVTRDSFTSDLRRNYTAMSAYGIKKSEASFFLPPYEWYNDTIAKWAKNMGLQIVNFTPGTLSHTDYTTPDARNYRSSGTIFQSITRYGQTRPSGLAGFILLLHIGTDSRRTDKFYTQLPQLLHWLKEQNYQPVRIDELLDD